MTDFNRDSEGNRIHPYVNDLKSQLDNGKISRRQFLRHATLLGVSAAAAMSFVSPLMQGVACAAMPKRGGTWKCVLDVKRLDHPARLAWISGANIIMQFCEHLTVTGPDNITRPYLAEKWSASDDLKTWDFHLRKGVKFNNGDIFSADDVMFTMKEWLTKEVGSSMFGLLSYVGGYQNVEKVNDHQIRLHLEKANLAVPEHLFHYPGFVLHRKFEGDIIKQPVGTGPFMLKEFVDGERAVFEARKDYWQKGADGKPMPYLDKIIYVHMDKDAGIAALSSGQVDSLYEPRSSDVLVSKNLPNVETYGVDTAMTQLVRMRVDQAPWNDNRVRTAMKLCQDREKILKLAAMKMGTVGIDAHVAPAHPEYVKKPIQKYDPKKAKALLEEYAKEKGLKLPLKVSLATKNDGPEPEIAQALKELARPGGFDIQLDITEPSKYWSRWTEVPFGITNWSHRPLATMVLPLAYTKESIGAWNETRWVDEEFETYLNQAQKTINLEERRKIISKIEDIMLERGSIGISFYNKFYVLCNKRFKNVHSHPSMYHTFTHEMWMDA